MLLLRFLPAIVWFIASLVLLCLPGSTIPKYPWLATIHADKWIHITLFFVLCFLFARPFNKSPMVQKEKQNRLLLITIACIAYGSIMEFVQDQWIPNRSFEWMDILADSTGAILAYVYCRKKFGEGQ